MPRLAALVASLSCFVFGCATSEYPDPQTGIALVGGFVVDPGGEAPPYSANILMSGGKVVSVGSAIKIPKHYQTVDVAGKFIVPGLWDMHAHLAALDPVGSKPLDYVSHGVLAVRDMGGHVDELLAYRSSLDARVVGPEIVMAGGTLNGEASGDWHIAVTTDSEGRAAVQQMKAKGADFIKVHRATKPDVFRAIVDEARRVGLHVAGHVPLGMSWPAAADAGMQTIEHAVTMVENEMALPKDPAANILVAAARIDGAAGDDIIAALVRNKTYLDPTLIAYESKLASAEPSAAAVARNFYMRVRKFIGRANAAGVAIVAGTDLVDRPGAGLLDELDLLVASGLTPREALRSATVTAAKAAGRPELGQIHPGGPASFIVLDADPTLDIRDIRKLSIVMLRGRILDRASLASPSPPNIARQPATH